VLLVVAAAGFWLVSGAGRAAGAGGTILGISPASQNVALDSDPFMIDVTVSNVANLGAYDITLTFNKDVLEYIGIARGPFIGSSGRTASCIAPFPGPNGATATENVNNNGALHFGCNTVGIVQGDEGKPGPSGDGTLMRVGFKPKAPGAADIVFRGFINGKPYTISPAGGAYAGETGSTSLGTVEVCGGAGGCTDGLDIPFDRQGGVVQVIDPNAPEPTAPPATPTVAPAGTPVDVRKTVEAALGTPERRVDDGTPVPGAPDNGGGGAIDSVAGASNGGGSDSSGGGGSDSVTSAGSGSSGGTSDSVAGAGNGGGGTNDSVAGASSSGGRTGDIAPADPVAGPQPGGSSWRGRVVLTLALAGVGAIVAFIAVNRRRRRA
jgi:hypothetical protein